MIAFDESVCRQLDQAAQRERLETNGVGGFASSTIVGMNTRRYHGLLVASLKPPVGRYVLLSKLEETLLVDGVAHDLSVNQYPGAIHPQGYHYLKAFRLDPFPVFTYEVQNIEVEKRLFLVHGENTVVVQYKVQLPEANVIGAHTKRPHERKFTASYIDQGYCFNAGEWSFPDAPLRGVFGRNDVYDGITGWDSFEPWLSRIESFPESSLWPLVDQIPPEWYDSALVELERLLSSLLERRSRVRDLILSFKNSSRNPFPNWRKVAN